MDILSMMQNPAVRTKLLRNLSMSPIDPMAAMQQLQSAKGGQQFPGGPQEQVGGAPQEQTPFANMLQGPGAPQLGVGVQPPIDMKGPVPGAPGVQLPPGAFPGGPQVPGLPPEVPTPVPGAPGVTGGDFPAPPVGGASGLDPNMMKMMLSGLSGMSGGNAPPPAPRAAPAPQHSWSPFQADMLQTPETGKRMTLAQLIYGR